MREKMQKCKQQLIKNVLQAAADTDYYKKLFKENGICVDEIKTYDDFIKIPITTKEEYRTNKYDFICNSKKKLLDIEQLKKCAGNFKACDKLLEKGGFNMVITSGSTGIPLEVIHSNKDDYRNYYMLNRYRRKFKEFSITEKYIWLLPMNEKTKCMFFEKENKFLKDEYGIQYFLTNYSDEYMKEMHKLVEEEKPTWITGSPTAVATYAQFLKRNGLSVKFNYIELHSEPCFSWQAAIIEEVFKTNYSIVYSSNEINFIAASCQDGKLHILEDNVFVELLESEQEGVSSQKVVLTGLNYLDTPFIRYEIGDLAKETYCETCKKDAIELTGYRCSDMIYFSDETVCEPYIIYDSIFFMNAALKCDVLRYQVTQSSLGVFEYELDCKINDQLKERMIKFLEDFLSEGLCVKIKVIVNEMSKEKMLKNQKYKRFVALSKNCT